MVFSENASCKSLSQEHQSRVCNDRLSPTPRSFAWHCWQHPPPTPLLNDVSSYHAAVQHHTYLVTVYRTALQSRSVKLFHLTINVFALLFTWIPHDCRGITEIQRQEQPPATKRSYNFKAGCATKNSILWSHREDPCEISVLAPLPIFLT